MTKLRTRLLFALITLIIIVLISLGLILGQLFKNYYINIFNERVEKENSLVALHIEENGGIQQINKTKTNEIGEILQARVTIVTKAGEVLHDSGEFGGTSLTKHKELINRIIRNKEEPIVEVANDDQYLHYYWTPIYKDDTHEGYLIISTKMDELKKSYSQLWWLLIISLGLALFVIILLGTSITTRYTKPIESATKVAIELAKGNYRARTNEDNKEAASMLSKSINILAGNLQDLAKTQEMQQDRLTTLIENMGSGLILIDGRGFINLVNRTYKEVFNVSSDQFLGKLYYEAIEDKEVSSLVEEIFMTEQKVRRQMLLTLKMERRHFEVYGAPIIGTNNVWKGILLVFHDITELKKLEQMRKDFVANVSHELKTPITSIKGFSETLLDGAMKDEQALQAFLSIILKESDRLQSLVKDLLDLSKIEQEGFTLNTQLFNFNSLLEEIVTLLNKKADEKMIQLKFESSDKEITMNGDIDRLKQVFINLINNGITYTPQGGVVKVKLIDERDQVIIDVIDTGIGIEEKELPRIFERFYRVDKARSRNSGGTGLGLAIVKHIVEAHKGTIIVRSKVGEGTVFSVKLPKY
ncbi:PAS domain-containing protein [Bacillus aquiflavi]|uniref:histidine kinase n=1 Tax=Bacillus aquiflavi TaxID=2672567 RepID=A0A6B3W1H2_9BACI|nr:ATP-binding protein [Bacillus aquiflavi]MBA4537097.1 PAS domain-containing protein [Bacillus aquiflavi]NEY81394.1 cell wall metabolism sensor histidine kinase WalK [Bacillus aquiflavi]